MDPNQAGCLSGLLAPAKGDAETLHERLEVFLLVGLNFMAWSKERVHSSTGLQ